MERKIKDYLHLYVGCDLDTSISSGYVHPYGLVKIYQLKPSNFWNIMSALDRKERDFKGGYSDSDHIYCKPILRPLSDMAEEEATDLVKFITVPKRHETIRLQEITDNHIWYIDGEMWHGDGVSEVYDKYAKFNELTGEQFRFLLSKGFDLFNLIPDGLAIDATTLKKQSA